MGYPHATTTGNLYSSRESAMGPRFSRAASARSESKTRADFFLIATVPLICGRVTYIAPRGAESSVTKTQSTDSCSEPRPMAA